jgi:hypothetical protein
MKTLFLKSNGDKEKKRERGNRGGKGKTQSSRDKSKKKVHFEPRAVQVAATSQGDANRTAAADRQAAKAQSTAQSATAEAQSSTPRTRDEKKTAAPKSQSLHFEKAIAATKAKQADKIYDFQVGKSSSAAAAQPTKKATTGAQSSTTKAAADRHAALTADWSGLDDEASPVISKAAADRPAAPTAAADRQAAPTAAADRQATPTAAADRQAAPTARVSDEAAPVNKTKAQRSAEAKAATAANAAATVLAVGDTHADMAGLDGAMGRVMDLITAFNALMSAQVVTSRQKDALEQNERLLLHVYNVAVRLYNLLFPARPRAIFPTSKEGASDLLARMVEFELQARPHPSWIQGM